MPTISLLIPVYNEASHLEKFLQMIDDFTPPIEKELVIIDDASTDGSGKIIDDFRFKSRVKIHHHQQNMGKGSAISNGINLASGDFIGIQDADFEYDPQDILKILGPLISDKADVVYGSRFRGDTYQVHRTFHYFVNRILTLTSNIFSGLYITDMETCYKFFRADLIKNIVLTAQRFGFEPEVTAKISRLQVRVMELPIYYYPRCYLEGKKITWRDGLAALGHIFFFNVLTNPKKCFKDSMPKKYQLVKSRWL